MDKDQRVTGLAVAAGLAVPLAAAAAMVPLRRSIDNANVALILAGVVVAVASLGRRSGAVLAAVSGMVWFDFFHTRPYESFTINRRNDLITAVVLLAVGLFVGELAVRSRRHLIAAKEGSDEIALIHSVAELVACGADADTVIARVATELEALLSLRDCRFDAGEVSRPIARIERSGDVVFGQVRWGVHSIGFPGKEVELPVIGGGQTYGRYVLVPTTAVRVSFDRRVVAVALADQVGAALAAVAVRTP